MARHAILAAEEMYVNGHYRGAANRSYYASYHAATAVAVEHGDSDKFANGWNNPSHDQLPDLIKNNGGLELSVRRRVRNYLAALRGTREDADYRPGRTVNQEIALERFQRAKDVLRLLEVT